MSASLSGWPESWSAPVRGAVEHEHAMHRAMDVNAIFKLVSISDFVAARPCIAPRTVIPVVVGAAVAVVARSSLAVQVVRSGPAVEAVVVTPSAIEVVITLITVYVIGDAGAIDPVISGTTVCGRVGDSNFLQVDVVMTSVTVDIFSMELVVLG